MFLPDISIRRPVMATMLSVALLVVGWIGVQRLPVREIPEVDLPIVTVTAVLPGASPEVIETEVVEPIEEEVSTTEGIQRITSESREEVGTVTIEFDLGRDIDVAAQDIRDKVSRIRAQLPDEVKEPVVSKLDLDAFAVMWLAVISDDWGQLQVSQYAEDVLKERIQRLPGVGSVIVGGRKRFAVRVRLDADRLAGYGLTVDDVSGSLRRENVEIPSGRIESVHREFSVKTEGEFDSPEAFNDLILAWVDGAPVRLRDVGRAERGVENERNMARFNGKPAVGLGVLKQSEANAVEVVRLVRREMERIRPELPSGVEVHVAFDSSQFIEESVREVKETLVIAGLLVVIVIFLFLRGLVATVIPALAIPTSLMGTFAAMYFLGFTTNNLTLLALVLAIGVLVDDAIVMLENIHRHIEAGEPRMDAAFAGSREIGFAILTASVTICAVFVPVAFAEGIVGRFFFEFGITVAVAVALSTLVALTLTPMLCSRFLRAQTHQGGIWDRLESGYEALARRYRKGLERILRFRGPVLLGALAVFVGGMLLLGGVGTELLPDSDRAVFVVLFDARVGSTLGFADRYVRQVEEVLGATPELQSYFTALALARGEGPGEVNRGLAFVRMIPASDRERSQIEVMAELRRKLTAIPGLISFPVSLSAIPTSGGFQAPVQLVLLGDDFEQLAESSRRFTDRISRIPGIMDVDTDLELDKPELRVRIDRDKAADLGVSVGTIASTLQVLLGGQEVTTYKSGGEQYDVIVQLHARDRMTPRDMDRIHVRTGSGALVPLSSFLDVGVGVGPSSLNHVDKERAVTVTANLEGLDLGQALEKIDAVAAEVLPGGVRTVRAGQAEDFEESARSLLLTFALSIAFIYMVLASQFNSFLHPFTIMLSLPLGLVGAFASLFAFDMTLNIYSAIGIILLMGIVTKNAILLVDYTNTLRSRGIERTEAVLRAAQVRLRPILMTAVSTGFGVLPIALGWGAGAESRRPMGMAVLGGLITSTLLTLIVVPIVYTYLDDAQGWFRRGAAKPADGPPQAAG